MRWRDFRIGWRLLAREPAYSAIVIAGLALGFAVCVLLLGFVRYCFTYDSAVPNAARVFVLQHKVNLMPHPTWTEFMPLPFQQAADGTGLASQASAAIPREVAFVVGDVAVRDEVTAVDPAFAAMFGLAALEGSIDAGLARPEGLVLTSSMARKLFGGQAARASADRRPVRPRFDSAPLSVLVMPKQTPEPARQALRDGRRSAGRWRRCGCGLPTCCAVDVFRLWIYAQLRIIGFSATGAS